MMVKERILWVDFAKVICIILVVLGHMSLDSSYLNFIYSFHIPLFFFISGFLDKNRSISDQLKNGAKTLLIPYTLLYLVCYLIWLPMRFFHDPEHFGGVSWTNALIKPMIGLFLGEGNFTSYSIMVCLALWFLVALFVIKVLHAFLIKISKHRLWCYLVLVALLSPMAMLLKNMRINIFFSIDSALLALPFYALGYALAQEKILHALAKLHIRDKGFAVLFGVICFIVLSLVVPENGKVDIDLNIYGNNLGLFYLFGFLGIFSMILVSLAYVRPFKLLTTVSNGTIIILAFHGWVTKIILLITGLGSRNNGFETVLNPLTAIGIAILTVLLFAPLIILVKKYFPVLMGGRK